MCTHHKKSLVIPARNGRSLCSTFYYVHICAKQKVDGYGEDTAS